VNRLARLLTVSISIFGVALAIGCADETTSPGDVAFGGGRSVMPIGFARCDPQPYDSTSARIGRSGGTLRVGRHTLNIPAGALKKNTVITMVAPSDTLNYVVFSPEGLVFDPAHLPTLKMSYTNCRVADFEEAPVDIVYVNDSLTAVLETTELLETDFIGKSVIVTLKHFSHYVVRSRYAVAY
jgi:hypothetical protein